MQQSSLEEMGGDGIKTQVESTDLENKTFFFALREAVVESDRVFFR